MSGILSEDAIVSHPHFVYELLLMLTRGLGATVLGSRRWENSLYYYCYVYTTRTRARTYTHTQIHKHILRIKNPGFISELV